jgi:hypothetical protein
VANAEELIDLCVPESDQKEQLLFAICKFNAATGIMRQKSISWMNKYNYSRPT